MPPTSPKLPHDERMFLLAAAQWQDSLLQSYRMLHVTIQGFLLAAGVAVLAVQLTSAIQTTGNNPVQVAVFSTLFSLLIVTLLVLQRKTAAELKHVVDNRAEDVNHWHRLIVVSENGFPHQQRPFTVFKRWQQLHRADLGEIEREYPSSFEATSEYASKLISKGLGHTREVIDRNLFDRVHRLWILLACSSAGMSLWFAGVAALDRLAK